MLKTLCELPGISGDEGAVRTFIATQMQRYCDQIRTDKMGNLICTKKGTAGHKKRLMLAAHMDEVGLLVKSVTSEGFVRFVAVGGLDSRVLVSKTVKIGKAKVAGVIGAKPAHLFRGKERKVLPINELFIDIGAESEQAAAALVSPGDSIVFDSDYIEFGDHLVKSKALDDRVGCFLLMELAKETYPNDIDFVFTVQEEVGCRGAAVAAHTVHPDFAFVVECTTCADVPGTPGHRFSTRLGNGPAVSMMDGGACADQQMADLLINTAKGLSLPIQYKQTMMGGNDSRTIHLANGGIRTAAISIPGRYIHSPASVVSLNDISACLNTLRHLLKQQEGVPWNC